MKVQEEDKVKIGEEEPFLQQLIKSVHNSDLFFTEDVIPSLFGDPSYQDCALLEWSNVILNSMLMFYSNYKQREREIERERVKRNNKL